jgi:hypothetical protein
MLLIKLNITKYYHSSYKVFIFSSSLLSSSASSLSLTESYNESAKSIGDLNLLKTSSFLYLAANLLSLANL